MSIDSLCEKVKRVMNTNLDYQTKEERAEAQAALVELARLARLGLYMEEQKARKRDQPR